MKVKIPIDASACVVQSRGTMSNITLQEEGRRVYIVGNSYPIKNEINAAGGHWDPERKAWWIGSGKKEVIRKALDKVFSGPPRDGGFPTGMNVKVAGKVRYKGKVYAYSFFGETKLGGRSYKLHFADGSKDFWAKESECERVKTYREPLTLKRLAELREEYKKSGGAPRVNHFGLYECPECGDKVERGTSCWETGMTH